MSQIGSSSGVRVAAQPLSNVYTVLLLVGAVALVLALVLLCVVMDRNYGTVLGFTKEGATNKQLPESVADQQKTRRGELEEADRALNRFPEGISASAGTAPSGAGTSPAPAGGTTAPDTGGGTAPGAGTAEPAGAPAGN
ncbi:MAG: hypothetical protein U9R68_05935 [Planctomycetota bacterium]|nr:hypothetical protein [Planctomycetota bacterium]